MLTTEQHERMHVPLMSAACNVVFAAARARRFFNGDYYEGKWDKGVREGIGMQQVRAGGAALYLGAGHDHPCERYGHGKCNRQVAWSNTSMHIPAHPWMWEQTRAHPHTRAHTHTQARHTPPPCSLQCTDDSNYVGEYARGKRHGYGVYSFPNGDQYTGEYEEDLPQVGGQVVAHQAQALNIAPP